MSSFKKDSLKPLLFALVLAIGMFLGYNLRDKMPRAKFLNSAQNNPIDEIIQLVQAKYAEDVPAAFYADSTIQKLLDNLDPHSVYLPPEELKKANEYIQGNFSGIGIEVGYFKDTFHIIQVLNKAPAQLAGLEVGDRIISVDNISYIGKKNFDSVSNSIKGKNGTNVTLKIFRNGNLIEKTITRGVINISSIDAAYLIADKTGYIKVNKFSENTYPEFLQALENLDKKGMQKLILDLRNNGGGLMSPAIGILDEFIEGKKLLTYTMGRTTGRKEENAKRPGLFEDASKKLVVLSNEGSASASEVVMGALQDWDRAVIIGQQSFGKGLVQQQFDLSNGGALRLTVAKYYTPFGRSLQRNYKNGEHAYKHEVYERMLNKDKTPKYDSANTKFITTHNKRKLPTDVGIVPDIIVNEMDDQAFDDSVFSNLIDKNIASAVAYEIYLKYKKDIEKFSTAIEFDKNFILPNEYKILTQQKAIEHNIKVDKMSPFAASVFETYIKALVARIKWRSEGFYIVNNNHDKTIKTALAELNK